MNETLLVNESEADAPESAVSLHPGGEATLPNYHENNILSEQYGTHADTKPDGDVPEHTHDGLPDCYELHAPEGMEFDTVLVEQFTPVAKELGLNNAQAQKLADLYGTRVQATCQDQLEQWSEMGKTAESRVRADAELGGMGEAFKRKRDVMQRGLASLPQGDELAEAIQTGGAVHPNNLGLLRLLYREGLRISPDDFHGGGRMPQAPRDFQAVLYPKDTNK